MMNNALTNSYVYYGVFLLAASHATFSASSPAVLYPPLNQLIDNLFWNATLPSCTVDTCQQTETQANFSTKDLSNDELLKLSTYNRLARKRTAFQGPYLLASTGIYRGKRLKYNRRYIDQFLGIYYAEIPGSLKKPVKKHFQYAIQNATKFTPCCMQSSMMTENLSYGSFHMHHHFDDNCLSLNIYRADLRFGEKQKAIMLFSHGGSNQLGGGSLFDGSVLASEGDIIVVTMNFRLNYHGFLSTGDDRLKGNYGLWDQLLAVEWIYENAHLFGGDPHRIVLAGHSAGAGNVMLIPASSHCHGMIRRIISQSGTGLAPWSINRNPLKLLEHFARKFKCQRMNDNDMLECLNEALGKRTEDIYHLNLSLNIADDNPYPVIDHDLINDTMENLLQSDAYKNIDFLTGVTLNEGLYFAEYHIKHLYSTLLKQSASKNRTSVRNQRAVSESDLTKTTPPDILLTSELESKEPIAAATKRKSHKHRLSKSDLQAFLDQFTNMNYVERYIEANFQHSGCFMDEVKNRYDAPGKDNITDRIQLYIDLVSDLMFNFHMVHCLNLRAKIATKNSSNYAYVYSHRPTYKVRSTLRDQLKLLPNVVGHFAELDYVFGVPLVGNYSRFHRNVNMSYYNYSSEEEKFSRQLIHYWSNFIKTGNPNKGSLFLEPLEKEWQSYTEQGHNYLFFQLNQIRNERNYFDSMYEFWFGCYRIEKAGVCRMPQLPSNLKRALRAAFVLFLILLSCLVVFLIWKYIQQRKKGGALSSRSPAPLLPHPRHVSA